MGLIPLLITAYASLLLLLAVVQRQASARSIGIAVVGVIGIVSSLASYARRWSWPGLVVPTFLWLVLAYGMTMLVGRLGFVLWHGGMDGPEGYGSPAAFLIGLVFEQAVFTGLALGLLVSFLSRWNRTRAKPALA